jgi:hypothetical protein
MKKDSPVKKVSTTTTDKLDLISKRLFIENKLRIKKKTILFQKGHNPLANMFEKLIRKDEYSFRQKTPQASRQSHRLFKG